MDKTHVFRVVAAIFAASALLSCSSIHKDGPPKYDVDVSRIPDAVPKKEPLAKYGNMHAYDVFGKRYYTLKSSRDYEQVGVASWYGRKFHSRLTSSGERYDMLSMTAAHKTLPLPTYVEVTNLRNNRKVVVKVNDRGPFSSNRIIDLSYVAAKKLGMLGRGTTKVRVKAIDPGSYDKPSSFFAQRTSREPIAPVRNATQQQAIYLQVGAFRNKANAEHLKQRLAKIVSAPVIVSQSTGHKKFYHVKVGPVENPTSVKHTLSSLGLKSLLVG